jgi:hypothetical protein
MNRPPCSPGSIIGTFGLALVGACGPVLHIGIPAPRGPNAVGRMTFALTDSSRRDPWSSDTAERRVVLVKAWYPAATDTGPRAPYLENASRLPGSFAFGERWLVKHLGTHAAFDAPAATGGPRWSVLLFSPGANTPPDYYAGLIEELASIGYLVLAMDHSYEGRGQVLPNGRVLDVESERQRPTTGGAVVTDFTRKRLDVRAGDASFLLDAMQRGAIPRALLDRTDLTRVGALGHSLGGLAAEEICRRDRRVRACANIDGLVRALPGLPTSPGSPVAWPHPLLYVGKPIPATRGVSVDSGWAAVRRMIATGGGGYDVLMEGVSHDAFTDSPFMEPTVRPVARRGHLRAVRDVTVAFFDKTLRNLPAPILDDTAAVHPANVRVHRVDAVPPDR